MWTKLLACAAAATALSLGACATAYQAEGITGGFKEVSRGADVWRVSFLGNGYTTNETTQTYWLYHCAQLARSKGYDGFRIVTPMKLAVIEMLPDVGGGQVIRVGHSSGGHSSGGAHYTYVYTGGGYASYKPSMTGDIQLLKAPIKETPLLVFDAAKLEAAMAPYVNGPKCGGNVCAHVHKYLYPGLETPGPKSS
jgi:hypothetical protein